MTRLGSLNTGAGIGLVFETLTDVASATIDVDTLTLRTDGYAAAGDGGQGLYVRLDAAPSDPTNNAYTRSVDRYTLSGSTDVTHGGYWALVAEGGEVRIEQFGGAGDASQVGVGGTDNYTPLINALAYYAKTNSYGGTPDLQHWTYRIRFGPGHYRVSDTIELHVSTHIVGSGQSGLGSFDWGTMLHFPEDRHCFIFSAGNTSGDSSYSAPWIGNSGGSILEGFGISQNSDGLTSANWGYCGVLARTTPNLHNMGFFLMAGKAIYLRAYAGSGGALEGNCNNWSIRDCYVNEAGSDALHVEGADVNGGSCSGFVTAPTTSASGAVRGCGVRNESYLPNIYTGLQISGYGNTGVTQAGLQYVLIDNTAGIGAATTPGTDNTVWYYMRTAAATTQFPAWSALETYTLQLPIFDSGGSSEYINPYVEVGSAAVLHILPGSFVTGGTCDVTQYSSRLYAGQGSVGGDLWNQGGGFGSYTAFISGSPEYTQNGAVAYVRVGGASRSYFWATGGQGGLNILHFHRETGSAQQWDWAFYGNDIEFRVNDTERLWMMTTSVTTEQFGRGVIQPNKLVLFDHVLRNYNNYNSARHHGMRTDRPSTGTHAAGDLFFETDPASWGTVAWSVTAGGTPGTIHSVPVFGLTTVTPQYNGHLVLECTSNTTVTLKYKGSDGTIRSGTITLS
jgi:hypothetical protein